MSRQLILLLVMCVVLIGCATTSDEPKGTITLATTTSTRDSGLLDVLVPMFEDQTGIKVKVIAVGSGQALEMGRRGDADVLLTHAPAAEKKFMAEGNGSKRLPVMHNDFVLLGPQSDPAKIQGETSIAEAFTRIAGSKSPFVSRGDESGTHMKEKRIWGISKIHPGDDWYIQTGTGMAQALRMASEKTAYTLTDRGTFLAQHDRLDLIVLCEGDPLLLNRYSVILVNPIKHPHVSHTAAQKFSDFLLSPETQKTIGKFGVEKHGQPLFFPKEAATQE